MKILIRLTCQETIRIKVILRQTMDWIYLLNGKSIFSGYFPGFLTFEFVSELMQRKMILNLVGSRKMAVG